LGNSMVFSSTGTPQDFAFEVQKINKGSHTFE
jgi:hypothetical protein